MDRQGTLLIHPEMEKQNVAKTAFFNSLKEAKDGEFKIRYRWPETGKGEWKYLYFEYFAPFDSYIGITLDEKEINGITTRMLIMIIASMFLTLMLLYFVLTKTLQPIIRQILEATELTKKVSEGDLTSDIQVTGKDELGILIRSLQNMQGKLREMVLKITTGADTILQTSQKLDAGSRMISQGASDQATSVEEITSTLEEFTMNMEQNTLSSRRTETMALNALEGISRSN
jgi:methyl-accepting chemotaxis protein